MGVPPQAVLDDGTLWCIDGGMSAVVELASHHRHQRRLGALARGGSRGREPCADEREQVGDIVSLAIALLEVFTVGRGAAVDGHFVLGGVFERTVLVAAVLVASGVVVDGALHAYGVLGITNCNGIVQELS